MVRLWRGPAPPLLREHGAAWTQRWEAMRAGGRTGDWATQGARKVLSDELKSLTFGKCAFCEGLLEVTSYLEIDHYVAKALRAELAFEWENLLPVCRLCNRAKGDIDHAGMLIKPDVEDPESVLWLHPDTGELQPRAKLESGARQRVERTLELCNLQRGALCTKRIETMQSTIRWLERLSRRDSGLRHLVHEEWGRLIDPRTEYKFVIRHVLELRRERRLAKWDRSRFRTPVTK